MRTLLAAIAMIAVVMSPAYGQGKKGAGPNTELGAQDEAHKKDAKDVDNAYNNAVKGTRTTAKPYDPWGAVRPPPAGKN